MNKLQVKYKISYIAIIVVVILLCTILIPNIGSINYLFGEFIFKKHYNLDKDCLTIEVDEDIPKMIHQIYTGYDGKPIPSEYLNNLNSWKRTYPNYTHTLWNASMIEKLIFEKYPEFVDLYFGYSQWINRVDMSKYVIMYEHGGIYADLDLVSVAKEPSISVPKHTGVVLYKQFLIGIKADFMVSRRKHIFLAHVLDGLKSANRWFLIPHFTTMFRAGPLFLHGRFLNYPCQGQLELLTPNQTINYFYDSHSGAWHSYDTRIIDILFDYIYTWIFLFCLACILFHQKTNISIKCRLVSNCCVKNTQLELDKS